MIDFINVAINSHSNVRNINFRLIEGSLLTMYAFNNEDFKTIVNFFRENETKHMKGKILYHGIECNYNDLLKSGDISYLDNNSLIESLSIIDNLNISHPKPTFFIKQYNKDIINIFNEYGINIDVHKKINELSNKEKLIILIIKSIIIKSKVIIINTDIFFAMDKSDKDIRTLIDKVLNNGIAILVLCNRFKKTDDLWGDVISINNGLSNLVLPNTQFINSYLYQNSIQANTAKSKNNQKNPNNLIIIKLHNSNSKKLKMLENNMEFKYNKFRLHMNNEIAVLDLRKSDPFFRNITIIDYYCLGIYDKISIGCVVNSSLVEYLSKQIEVRYDIKDVNQPVEVLDKQIQFRMFLDKFEYKKPKKVIIYANTNSMNSNTLNIFLEEVNLLSKKVNPIYLVVDYVKE